MSAWCRPVPCSVVQVSACTPAHTSRCGTHAHMCAPSTHYLQDSEPITCLALSPDKHSLVAASRSLSVRLWDWTTGECRRTWKVSTHTHTAGCCCHSSSGATACSRVQHKEQPLMGLQHSCSQQCRSYGRHIAAAAVDRTNPRARHCASSQISAFSAPLLPSLFLMPLLRVGPTAPPCARG